MSSANKIKVMSLKELSHYVGTKSIWDTSLILPPAFNFFFRISPQQITKNTLIRNIDRTRNPPDIIQALEIRGKSTVHTEDLVVNESSNRKTVEAVGETLPQSHVVFSFAFIVETVDTVDRSAFVVASEKKEVELVFELVGKEKAYGLYALLTTINIVPKEQVVRSWRVATVLKQTQEVWKLTVNISCSSSTYQLIMVEERGFNGSNQAQCKKVGKY